MNKTVISVACLLFLSCSVEGEGLKSTTGAPTRGPATRDAEVQIDAVIGDAVGFECWDEGIEITPCIDLPVVLVTSGEDADASVDTKPFKLQDATPGYTANGVFVDFGPNPCGSKAWDPKSGKCFAPKSPADTHGFCGSTPPCGSYDPGTLLLWDAKEPKYRYLADPTEGTICLPNDVVYTVSC